MKIITNKKRNSSHENCIKKISEAESRMEKKFKGVKYKGWFEATVSLGGGSISHADW